MLQGRKTRTASWRRIREDPIKQSHQLSWPGLPGDLKPKVINDCSTLRGWKKDEVARIAWPVAYEILRPVTIVNTPSFGSSGQRPSHTPQHPNAT